MSKDFKVKNGLQVTTNITASGNISSSGTITAFVSMSAAAFSGDGSGLTNVLPGGVVSSSGAGTSQGQFKLNGVDVDVNGLGGDGDVTFETLTLDAGGLKGV